MKTKLVEQLSIDTGVTVSNVKKVLKWLNKVIISELNEWRTVRVNGIGVFFNSFRKWMNRDLKWKVGEITTEDRLIIWFKRSSKFKPLSWLVKVKVLKDTSERRVWDVAFLFFNNIKEDIKNWTYKIIK